MSNWMKENEENKKRMALSIVCGVIAIIAVCSLLVKASYLALPIIAGIALIVFAIATEVVGIGAAAMLEVKAGYYECPREPVTSVTGSQ